MTYRSFRSLFPTRDKRRRERLDMYLQKKRHRHDPLRSVQGIREVVVELRVEAKYLELRGTRGFEHTHVYTATKDKNSFLDQI